jgi:hypothetical protein
MIKKIVLPKATCDFASLYIDMSPGKRVSAGWIFSKQIGEVVDLETNDVFLQPGVQLLQRGRINCCFQHSCSKNFLHIGLVTMNKGQT